MSHLEWIAIFGIVWKLVAGGATLGTIRWIRKTKRTNRYL